MSFESVRGPGGYRHLRLDLCMALRGHVAAGGRGVTCGLDAREIGQSHAPHRILRFCGLVCSAMATHDGSSASYVCFICLLVYVVQKTASAKQLPATISVTTSTSYHATYGTAF